jgi:integrase
MARLTSLPLADWPKLDRSRWTEACRAGTLLRPGGAAGHLDNVTQADLERRYGYYLEFLRRTGRLDPGSGAAELICPENYRAFLLHVMSHWNSVTMAGTSFKLLRMAQILVPGGYFKWLREAAKALKASSSRERSVLPGADELMEAGLTLVEEARIADHVSAWRRAIRFRTGLMIAFTAAHPIRAKNLRQLALGKNIAFDGGQWWLALDATETKERRPDVRAIHHDLVSHLEEYLTVYRPILLGRGKHAAIGKTNERTQPQPDELPTPKLEELEGPLWISEQGVRMSASGIATTLGKATHEIFGVAINPHAFRTAAATTSAWHAPSTPNLASGVLNHSDPRVTQQHYIRAQNFKAMAQWGDLVRTIKATDRHDAPRNSGGSSGSAGS